MPPISPLRQEESAQAIGLLVTCFGEELRGDAEMDIAASFEAATFKPQTFVARDGETLIGLIQSHIMPLHQNVQAFSWVCTAPEHRGKGIAPALIRHAEQDAIETLFKDEPGSFLLISAIEPDYYRRLGYGSGALDTYDGHPFMVKHHRI